MKKILATAAALSLMLLACGDETSTNASGGETATNESDQQVLIDSNGVLPPDTVTQDTVTQDSNSTSLKTVIANSGPCSLNHTGERNTAYLTNAEKDGYQIIIPDVSAIEYFTNQEIHAERVGDTLRVWKNDTVAILDWVCYVYYTFDIAAEDANIKYLKYHGNVFKVVSGPAPEKEPDTSCVVFPSEDGGIDSTSCTICSFSHSAGIYDTSCTTFPYDVYHSSSSVAASSSSAVLASTHHIITDANGQCGANSRSSDPLVDANVDYPSLDTVRVREAAIPPVAYRYVGTERTGFTIENLSITCGLVVDTLDVNVSGDTVYVNATFDRTNAQRCICNFKIDFAVENDPAYSHASVLVFDEAPGVNESPDIMEIVDMDVITVEEATGTRQAKDINLMCKNDRQTLNAPAAAGNTLLPETKDTTDAAPFAGRVVGNDGFDTIIISEAMMPCEIVFETFDVHASNGTLYVEPKVDPDSPITNCICPTRVTFKIEQNEAFSNTNNLVFDGGDPMPLKNGVVVDASVLKD